MKTNVVILQTGGTIASEVNKTSEEVGLKPTKGIHEIRKINGYEVELFPLMDVDSALMVDSHRIRQGENTVKYVSRGYDVIFTHGTDTLQLSALVQHYNLKNNPRRVVYTGALFAKSMELYDGDDNIRNSLIFAINGLDYNGVFIVIGKYVLCPDLWGKHHYQFHDPVIAKIRDLLEHGVEDKETLKSLQKQIQEPYDAMAWIENGEFHPRHHESAFKYTEIDGHFTVTKNDENIDGLVRPIDIRGTLPVPATRPDLYKVTTYRQRDNKKIAEAFLLQEKYCELKRQALNNKNNFSVIDDAEKLIESIGFNGDMFTVHWKDREPFFDKRCSLEKIQVIGAGSDPSIYLDKIPKKIAGFVSRGSGFGHVPVKDPKWIEFLSRCKKEEIPVVITPGEGVTFSDEYEVARIATYDFNCLPSGTFNDWESWAREATALNDRVYLEKIAKEFGLQVSDIIRGYIVNGTLFKNEDQRLRYEKHYNLVTNNDLIAWSGLSYEEGNLLTAASLAHTKGSTKGSNGNFLKYLHDRFKIF